jgi:hypothetical protein
MLPETEPRFVEITGPFECRALTGKKKQLLKA